MSNGKVMLGVLAGIATGAVLGVLFAPDKGSETRRKIGKKKDEISDDLKDLFNEFTESVSKKYGEVKEEVSEYAHQSNNK